MKTTKTCRKIYVPGVIRPPGWGRPDRPTRCSRPFHHDGDCDFNGYNHQTFMRQANVMVSELLADSEES